MEQIKGRITMHEANELDELRSAIDALQLMTDAILLTKESYNEHTTAEAFHFVANAARAKIDELQDAVTEAAQAV